jgi:predicted nucleic acid-binding protein
VSEFVLDCSMTMAWCFKDEATERTNAVRDQLARDTAMVPRVLWDLEVWNTLLVALRRGRIRALEENVRLLMALPVRRVGAPLERALELGLKHALSSYDALYLGLALREALPLATLDRGLAQAAQAEGLEVLAG